MPHFLKTRALFAVFLLLNVTALLADSGPKPITDCKKKLAQIFENSAEENKAFWNDWKSNPKPLSTKSSRGFLRHDVPPARGSKEDIEKLNSFLNQPSLPTEDHSPSLTQDLLHQASQSLPLHAKQAFSDWLMGQFSEDAIVNFEDHFLGRQRFAYPQGPTRYQKNGERPFDGYLAARKALAEMELQSMDLSQIKELHRLLMSRESARDDSGKIFHTDRTPARNSGALKDSELGQIRNQSVGFEFEGNHLPEGYSPISKTITRLLEINPFLEQTREGFVSYAPVSSWRNLDNRKPFSNDLIKKIQKIESEKGLNALANQNDPEVQEAQQGLLTELTQRVWEEAKRDIKTATTQGEVMDVVSKFQSDFVAIHPFFDGNGRLARLLTEKLLEARDLPAPLYTHWGEDLSLTRKEHSEYLGRSVLLSQNYHQSLSKAFKDGNTHDAVLNPALELRAKELLGDPSMDFDSKKFLNWVEAHREELSSFADAVREFHKENPPPTERFTSKDQKLAGKILGDDLVHFSPDEFTTWKKAQKDLPKDPKVQLTLYRQFLKDHIYEDKSGAIRLASPEFQKSFGSLSSSREEYEKKLASFYTEQQIYRGVPTNHYLSDGELAQLFALPTPMAMGNGVPYKNTPDSTPPVFQQYNSELLQGGKWLRQQIVDHKDGTSDGYFMSGMVSFSEKEGVGRTWQHHMGAPMGLLITAHKRKVGVINTTKYNTRFERLGMPGEYEEALVGGTDPESIKEIELNQRTKAEDQVIRRRKVARRVDYNKIEIIESVSTQGLPSRILNSTLWEIQENGLLKELPNTNPTEF